MTKTHSIVKQAINDRIFPGAVIGVLANDQKSIQAYGNFTYDQESPAVTDQTLYDLASITKVIPTGSLVLCLIEQGALSLDTKVIQYVPEIQAKYREEITVRHLLTYTVTFNLPRLSELALHGGQNVMDACYNAQLAARPGEKFIYNNLVSTILALIAQRATGKKFEQLANEMLFKPLGMNQTTFHPKTVAAPTEVDWRGTVQGQVHDESAWALMQANLPCGHAGLFSTANDLLIFTDMLLNHGTLNGKQFFKAKTVQQMHTNQLSNIGANLGLGWAIPGGQFDFFGTKVSDQAFGMTGFTGTSILIDPIKKRALAILANATFPKRKNDKEVMNTVRRQLANVVFG